MAASFGDIKNRISTGIEKLNLHSPLPESLGDECLKCADILKRFIKRKNEVDNTFIPPSIMQNAKGIAILTILKAGFVWSGRAGTGVVVARLPDGSWSAPSAIGVGGAGFGAQIGAQLTDCVFILNSLEAVEAFAKKGNVTLGANISIAAGPTGRAAEGSATMGKQVAIAPIYSYSKTKGLFAGISFEGSIIGTRSEANDKFYGFKVNANDLLSGAIPPPTIAEPLYRELNNQLNATSNIPSLKRSSLPQPTTNQNQYPSIRANSDTCLKYTPTSSGSDLPKYEAVPPMLPQKKMRVRALYDFKAEQTTDLSFNQDDIITVLESSDDINEWWKGNLNGKTGLFPGNYVEKI